jgi:hypothetical protein
MRLARLALWTPVHLLWTALALLWLCTTRRGCPLVFTHYHDLDGDGRDRQMGPLVDALGRACEVCMVPVGPQLIPALRAKRRPFVSLGALSAVATLLGPPWAREREAGMRARTRAARWLLRALRPSSLFLIDESGSGQPLLRAARRLGIRVVGVQHGDFRRGDRAYDGEASSHAVEPADVLCVWSAWFLERLLRISRVYSAANTRVTGRLRFSAAAAGPRPGHGPRVHVLLVEEADAGFDAAVAPFLEALRRDGGFSIEMLPHPARGGAALRASVAEAATRCDVALGRKSSALLEAVWWGCPAVVAGDDEADFRSAGLPVCATPVDLAATCRLCAVDRLAAPAARERVWGGAPGDPIGEVLAAGAVRETAAGKAAPAADSR